MSLTPGTRLGPYEIVGALGVGGMGDVYRATDTKLNRDVALKVLPESFALDADRIAGLTRVLESSGTHALVMALVEGQDVSEIIAGKAR